jgi:hypothetical protein
MSQKINRTLKKTLNSTSPPNSISPPNTMQRQQQGTVRQQQGTVKQQQGTVRQQQGTVKQQEGTVRQQQTTQQKNTTSTVKTSNRPQIIKVKSDLKNEKKVYNKQLLGIDVSQVKGIFPIMLNFSKVMSVLKSKNVKVTPGNAKSLLGEYINKYSYIDESFEDKIETYKDLLQLDNDFNTMVKTINLFSDTGTLTPRVIITVINNLILFYNEENKQELLIHYAYFAEIIYQHFSSLIDNTNIERNDFFDNDMVLDINAVLECSEFYYTDIYMLNSDEKAELMNTLKSYYLEEVSQIKNNRDKAIEESKKAEAQLEANKIAAKKEENAAEQKRLEEEKKKKIEKQKLNISLQKN